ncbi:hypothetical protein Patl1_15019 [Pistacia atlantica]|uniref:Uncharacterized protein n=1 Tax=Pistacia atlantica TaxID=434234 RepID=A0ACC1B9U8_9ROSI|nr:hypothetical protein Patl1_15019 [Pistacia atlantica]
MTNSDIKTSEIINSDKMQVYKGLEITTNKISLHERQNIPHHYLAEFERYFREYPSEKVESLKGKAGWDQMRRDGGWDLRRLDATAAVGKAGFSCADGAHDDDDHVFFMVVTVGLESGRSCDGIAGLVVVEVAMRVNVDGLLPVELRRLRRNESERKE